jgi:hypothetical protein
MTPAVIEGSRNTGALIVISVKSAHHRAAMSAGKLEPNPNANFPSKNKLPFTNRPTPKSSSDFRFQYGDFRLLEIETAEIRNPKPGTRPKGGSPKGKSAIQNL